jgi:2-succinyl-5-enolpyruvyl-6-hydroxy-3-cyclohexene-1-carboxylate synthase
MAERSRFAKAEMDVVRRPLTRRQIALEVWQNTWPHDQLVLGSSRMIRECDMAVPGKNIPVWSSRGLSGIDGTIATARGIAMARAHSGDPATAGITRAVLGDLAFLHDAGSLLLDKGEAEDTRLQVIVVRDGGGSLFDLLEASQSAEAEAFNRVLFTPAEANIEALAGAYGWNYSLAKSFGDLTEALAKSEWPRIIDCAIPRN